MQFIFASNLIHTNKDKILLISKSKYYLNRKETCCNVFKKTNTYQIYVKTEANSVITKV